MTGIVYLLKRNHKLLVILLVLIILSAYFSNLLFEKLGPVKYIPMSESEYIDATAHQSLALYASTIFLNLTPLSLFIKDRIKNRRYTKIGIGKLFFFLSFFSPITIFRAEIPIPFGIYFIFDFLGFVNFSISNGFILVPVLFTVTILVSTIIIAYIFSYIILSLSNRIFIILIGGVLYFITYYISSFSLLGHMETILYR